MVYDLVRQLPASLLTLAHQGVKAYSESFDLVHRREAKKPNAIWQVDHAQLSILLLKAQGGWHILTAVADRRNRRLQPRHRRLLSGFRSTLFSRTSLALRQGIWRKGHPHWHICGIPEVLYTDNGTDFTSKHCARLGQPPVWPCRLQRQSRLGRKTESGVIEARSNSVFLQCPAITR